MCSMVRIIPAHSNTKYYVTNDAKKCKAEINNKTSNMFLIICTVGVDDPENITKSHKEGFPICALPTKTPASVQLPVTQSH